MRGRYWMLLMLLIASTAARTGAASLPVVVFPNGMHISLPQGKYRLSLCATKCMSVEVRDGRLNMRPVLDGRTICASGDLEGILFVAASLPRKAQAKLLIHEAVHVAVDCDKRNLSLGERVAQTVSALLDSDAGRFIEEAR